MHEGIESQGDRELVSTRRSNTDMDASVRRFQEVMRGRRHGGVL